MKAQRQMWAIYGGGWLSYIRSTKREAIAEFLGKDSNRSWRWWKRSHSLRAVRVEVREL